MQRGMAALGLGVALVVALGIGAGVGLRGAAPPPPRRLQAELLEVRQAEARAEQAAQKGDFGEAARLSRQALEARRTLQGARHWQAVDAALKAERWQRLARLPADRQRRVG